ncbi:MAG: 3'-5' exonuclease [Steroidobacteraceae bacterium]|nr:3'-5' exonuclease [Steroidobacteraceae bacterium]MDW8258757.1 3'-5' exonuclease [Gammaproteobacteria bacterium]
MNTLVFDIETVPDVMLGRRLLGLEALPDAEVAKAMYARRRQQSDGGEFLSLEQHRVVAIACVLRSRDGFQVWSLGEPDSDEAELIRRFFDGVERYTPDLVSWNGSAFDLPVLTYRALHHSLQAPRLWETGEHDASFRWNNYVNRYHWRHCDLMDVLSAYQARGRTSLADMAELLGLPGKLGFSGAQVWDAYLAGDIAGIRRYCETDALNTYLIYLRFQLLRGHLTVEQHRSEIERVRGWLAQSAEPHWRAFRAAWPTDG